MVKQKSSLVNNSDPEVSKIFDLLKLDEAELARAIEDLFEQAAKDHKKREALERLVAAMKNPRIRAALNWSVRWGLAMEECRAARNIQQTTKKGEDN